MKLLSNNMTSSLIMTFSMLVYVLNDTFMKMVGPEIGLFQSIFVRGLIVTFGFIIFGFIFNYPLISIPKKYIIFLISRGLIEILLTCSFMTAIFNMPLANAIAILQAMPLVICFVASKTSGESLTNSHLSAIFVGLFGVLVILNPAGEGFNDYSIFALISVLLLVLRDLTTSKMPQSISSFQVAFFTATQITVCTGIVCCFLDWTPITFNTQLSLCAASFFIGLGYLASVAAVRIGDISFSAPFRYSSLLWAILFGAIFFYEIPNIRELLGAAIITICGIYVVLTDRNKKET